jgi:hypothetical protein
MIETHICDKLIQTEKTRGIYVSIATSILSFIFMFALSFSPMSLETSIIVNNIVGNFIGYSGDVLIAKQCFESFNGDEYVRVRYDQWDIEKRFLWYLQSLVSNVFMKFVFTVIIDILTTITLLDIVRTTLDKLNIKFKWRDVLIAATIPALIFILFGNELRFRYAYSKEDDFVVHLIVIAWAILSLMIYNLKNLLIARLDNMEMPLGLKA